MLGLAVRRFEQFAVLGDRLASERMTERELGRVLDELYPHDTALGGRAARNHRERRDAVMGLFVHGATVGNAPGSRWCAYNAIVEQHDFAAPRAPRRAPSCAASRTPPASRRAPSRSSPPDPAVGGSSRGAGLASAHLRGTGGGQSRRRPPVGGHRRLRRTPRPEPSIHSAGPCLRRPTVPVRSRSRRRPRRLRAAAAPHLRGGQSARRACSRHPIRGRSTGRHVSSRGARACRSR